jgi:hypothetical protein
MDVTRLGQAGLHGWRERAADRVARAALGALFFALSLRYVVRSLRAVARELRAPEP